MPRILTVALLIAALAPRLAGADPARPRNHGNSLSGMVVRVDAAAKTFVVRGGAGETTLVRTNATHVRGELKPGDRVAVRWLEKDGKKIATSVRIEPAAVATATPTSRPAGARSN
jgi:hypothetical protein